MSITIKDGNFSGVGIGILVNGDPEMSIDGLNIQASKAAFVQNKTPIDAAIFAISEMADSSDKVEALRLLATISNQASNRSEKVSAFERLMSLSANVFTILSPYATAIQGMI